MTGDLLGAYATGGLIGSLSAGLLVAAFYDLMPRRRPKRLATEQLPPVVVLDDARRARTTRKDHLA